MDTERLQSDIPHTARPPKARAVGYEQILTTTERDRINALLRPPTEEEVKDIYRKPFAAALSDLSDLFRYIDRTSSDWYRQKALSAASGRATFVARHPLLTHYPEATGPGKEEKSLSSTVSNDPLPSSNSPAEQALLGHLAVTRPEEHLYCIANQGPAYVVFRKRIIESLGVLIGISEALPLGKNRAQALLLVLQMVEFHATARMPIKTPLP